MSISLRYVAWVLLLAFCLAAPRPATVAAANEAETGSAVTIGQKVGEFTFKDIRFLPRRLADFGDKKAYVLVFTTIDCPLVGRYMPRLEELDKHFAGRGVQFVSINVGLNDPLREVAHQALKVDAHFAFVKDFTGQVAKAVGATRTPEAVLLDSERRLRYRGRIDSQFRLGGSKPDVGREDLKLAIEAVLGGGEVTDAETPVDGCLISFPRPAADSPKVTFAEDVAPLVQKHCQDCHRAGGSAPFALENHDQVSAHAETIAEVVSEQRMPPWFASRDHGQFVNRRELSSAERATIAAWVHQGAPLGDSAKLPAPRTFSTERWKIGTPDLVIQAPRYKLPATGDLPYKYAVLPHVFLHDTWVQGVQILPSSTASVHHCNMAYVQAGERPTDGNFITGQVPGGDAMILNSNLGFKIPRGSVLVLQIHHVATGQEVEDQISVGLVYSKEVIQKQLQHKLIKNTKFHIPPGDPHYRVDSERTLSCDATGVGMFTHMHVRGKDMTFRALYPDGTQQTLLSVPNYSFDWQIAYVWEPEKQKFPRGTRIECVAHYDNSVFNPYNPDPTRTVPEGQQTTDEMMYGFMFFTDDAEHLDLHVDPKTGRELSQK